MGKGENAGFVLPKTNFMFSVTFILLSASPFSLDHSKDFLSANQFYAYSDENSQGRISLGFFTFKRQTVFFWSSMLSANAINLKQI